MAEFVPTTAGLAAAAAATATGPFVSIVQFKLGSNFNTAASAADTNLIGAAVYTGVPTSYSFYDPTTIQINLEVPADAGPFDYGEVGLFMPGDVLFARMSYGVLRTKVESSVSGYANTLRIKALLRLAAGPSIFNFPSTTFQTVQETSTFATLQTPDDNLSNPVVLVHEPTDFQESILCYRHGATLWNISDYTKVGVAYVTAASDTTHITAALFGSLYTSAGSSGKYLIQTAGGYIRSISSISGNIATLTAAFNTAGLVSQYINVYQSNITRLAELAASDAATAAVISTLPSQISASQFWAAGDIKQTIVDVVPTGWLRANGATVSRTTYAALFAAIGTLYNTGGENGSEFRLPDFRGEFLRSWDNGRGVDVGRTLGSAQAGMVEAHTHSILTSGQDASANGYVADASSPNINSAATQSFGGTETRPRNVAVLTLIKT